MKTGKVKGTKLWMEAAGEFICCKSIGGHNNVN